LIGDQRASRANVADKLNRVKNTLQKFNHKKLSEKVMSYKALYNRRVKNASTETKNPKKRQNVGNEM
jgi:predicted DNA-binding protein YlxM (UPF0122 family)